MLVYIKINSKRHQLLKTTLFIRSVIPDAHPQEAGGLSCRYEIFVQFWGESGFKTTQVFVDWLESAPPGRQEDHNLGTWIVLRWTSSQKLKPQMRSKNLPQLFMVIKKLFFSKLCLVHL